MPEAPMRAIVWSTGWIGSIAIRAVNRRPDFALIGVWIHSPEKVGQDAGPLAGLEPIGLATTNDFEALLALAPDCVIYAASGPDRDGGGPRLRPHPRSRHQHCDGDFSGARVPARFRSHLDRGTHPGSTGWRSTLYASGIEPGFAADQLALVLATQSNSILHLVIRAVPLRPVPPYVHNDGCHGVREAARLRAHAGDAGLVNQRMGSTDRARRSGTARRARRDQRHLAQRQRRRSRH